MLVIARHSKPVYDLAWSPSERYLASVGGDRYIIIHDFETNRTVSYVLGPNIIPCSVCWEPKEKFLGIGLEDASIIILDATSGKIVRKLMGHSARISALVWGEYLISGGEDKQIMFWDPSEGECIDVRYGHEGAILDIALSPDQNIFASSGADRSILIWRTEEKKPIAKLSGHMDAVVSVAFSIDGKYVLSCGRDRLLRIWRTTLWKPQKTYRLKTIPSKAIWIQNTELVVAYSNGNIEIISTQKQETKTIEAHEGEVYAIDWAPNRKYLASGGKDGNIKIWENIL